MNDTLNQLGMDIVYTDDQAKYDAEAKRLLANREILARILKCTVPAFKDTDEQRIMTCIQDIKYDVSAMPGETNSHITGMPQESKVVNEGTIQYDIRFAAVMPELNELVQVLLRFDLEPMKESNYPYAIMNRGQVNAARMLSEQVGHNIKKDQYDNVQPVYSIWLMTSSRGQNAHAVTLFSRLEQHNITGSYKREKSEKNLLNIVIINLPENAEKYKNELTDLTGPLTALFSDTMKPEEKIEQLNHYGIKTTEKMKEEVHKMGSLSRGIYENGLNEGMKKGIQEGRSQGISIGEKKNREKTALNMIKAGKYSDQEIVDITGMTIKDIVSLRRKTAN